MNKISINQRLNLFLDEKNISNEELKKSIGLKSKQQVSNWKTLTDPIPDKHLIAIFSAFKEINANWLLTGDGNMILSEGSYKKPVAELEIVEEKVQNYGRCSLCAEKDKRILELELHRDDLRQQLGLQKLLRNGS